METVKNVCFWVAYVIVMLIKLPFSIASGVCAVIETLLAHLNVILLRLIGSEYAMELLEFGANININSANSVAEFWEDEKEGF